MSYSEIPENVKHGLDAVFGSITVGALMGWIAHATAVLSLIWVIIRIYETRTVQKLLGHRSRRADDED